MPTIVQPGQPGTYTVTVPAPAPVQPRQPQPRQAAPQAPQGPQSRFVPLPPFGAAILPWQPQQPARMARRGPVRRYSHDPFLKAIAENPRDPGPHLVLADHLEEHGHPLGAVVRAAADPESRSGTVVGGTLRHLLTEHLRDPSAGAYLGEHAGHHVLAMSDLTTPRGQYPDAPVHILAAPAAGAESLPYHYRVQASPTDAADLADSLGPDAGDALRRHLDQRVTSEHERWFRTAKWDLVRHVRSGRLPPDTPDLAAAEAVLGNDAPRPEDFFLRSGRQEMLGVAAAIRGALDRWVSSGGLRAAASPIGQDSPLRPRRTLARLLARRGPVRRYNLTPFLGAIEAHGKAVGPHLVLADYLEEQGHPFGRWVREGVEGDRRGWVVYRDPHGGLADFWWPKPGEWAVVAHHVGPRDDAHLWVGLPGRGAAGYTVRGRSDEVVDAAHKLKVPVYTMDGTGRLVSYPPPEPRREARRGPVRRYNHEPFLRAIEQHYGDEGPVKVWADHLEEEGHPLGAFVRRALPRTWTPDPEGVVAGNLALTVPFRLPGRRERSWLSFTPRYAADESARLHDVDVRIHLPMRFTLSAPYSFDEAAALAESIHPGSSTILRRNVTQPRREARTPHSRAARVLRWLVDPRRRRPLRGNYLYAGDNTGGGAASYGRRGAVRRYSHDGFLNAIMAHPHDPDPHLVYADWLEERGEPLGRVIREAVAAGQRTRTDYRDRPLPPEWRQINYGGGARWVGSLLPGEQAWFHDPVHHRWGVTVGAPGGHAVNYQESRPPGGMNDEQFTQHLLGLGHTVYHWPVGNVANREYTNVRTGERLLRSRRGLARLLARVGRARRYSHEPFWRAMMEVPSDSETDAHLIAKGHVKDDTGPFLVYADKLDEEGHPLGELIRRHVAEHPWPPPIVTNERRQEMGWDYPPGTQWWDVHPDGGYVGANLILPGFRRLRAWTTALKPGEAEGFVKRLRDAKVSHAVGSGIVFDRDAYDPPIPDPVRVGPRRESRSQGPRRYSHEAHLANIFAHPEDTNPDAVYADWLEERGHPLGTLIRRAVESGNHFLPANGVTYLPHRYLPHGVDFLVARSFSGTGLADVHFSILHGLDKQTPTGAHRIRTYVAPDMDPREVDAVLARFPLSESAQHARDDLREYFPHIGRRPIEQTPMYTPGSHEGATIDREPREYARRGRPRRFSIEAFLEAIAKNRKSQADARNAALVLADHLEETGHPLGAFVRHAAGEPRPLPVQWENEGKSPVVLPELGDTHNDRRVRAMLSKRPAYSATPGRWLVLVEHDYHWLPGGYGLRHPARLPIHVTYFPGSDWPRVWAVAADKGGNPVVTARAHLTLPPRPSRGTKGPGMFRELMFRASLPREELRSLLARAPGAADVDLHDPANLLGLRTGDGEPRRESRRGRPRRYSHEAFQAQIAAHPKDAGPVAVYADWLEEQGHPLGALIRKHLAERTREQDLFNNKTLTSRPGGMPFYLSDYDPEWRHFVGKHDGVIYRFFPRLSGMNAHTLEAWTPDRPTARGHVPVFSGQFSTPEVLDFADSLARHGGGEVAKNIQDGLRVPSGGQIPFARRGSLRRYSHEAFLNAIEEHGNDRAPHLVYADWLDERGDPLGRVIRLAADKGEIHSFVDNRRIGRPGSQTWNFAEPSDLWGNKAWLRVSVAHPDFKTRETVYGLKAENVPEAQLRELLEAAKESEAARFVRVRDGKGEWREVVKPWLRSRSFSRAVRRYAASDSPTARALEMLARAPGGRELLGKAAAGDADARTNVLRVLWRYFKISPQHQLDPALAAYHPDRQNPGGQPASPPPAAATRPPRTPPTAPPAPPPSPGGGRPAPGTAPPLGLVPEQTPLQMVLGNIAGHSPNAFHVLRAAASGDLGAFDRLVKVIDKYHPGVLEGGLDELRASLRHFHPAPLVHPAEAPPPPPSGVRPPPRPSYGWLRHPGTGELQRVKVTDPSTLAAARAAGGRLTGPAIAMPGVEAANVFKVRAGDRTYHVRVNDPAVAERLTGAKATGSEVRFRPGLLRPVRPGVPPAPGRVRVLQRLGLVRRYAAHEEFQKAILDNPGDPQPKLVYADWLQEQGHPGGDYLRALHESYKHIQTLPPVSSYPSLQRRRFGARSPYWSRPERLVRTLGLLLAHTPVPSKEPPDGPPRIPPESRGTLYGRPSYPLLSFAADPRTHRAADAAELIAAGVAHPYDGLDPHRTGAFIAARYGSRPNNRAEAAAQVGSQLTYYGPRGAVLTSFAPEQTHSISDVLNHGDLHIDTPGHAMAVNYWLLSNHRLAARLRGAAHAVDEHLNGQPRRESRAGRPRRYSATHEPFVRAAAAAGRGRPAQLRNAVQVLADRMEEEGHPLGGLARWAAGLPLEIMHYAGPIHDRSVGVGPALSGMRPRAWNVQVFPPMHAVDGVRRALIVAEYQTGPDTLGGSTRGHRRLVLGYRALPEEVPALLGSVAEDPDVRVLDFSGLLRPRRESRVGQPRRYSHEAHLAQIAASPSDRGRQHVYADWLEERGDPTARLVRAGGRALPSNTGYGDLHLDSMNPVGVDSGRLFFVGRTLPLHDYDFHVGFVPLRPDVRFRKKGETPRFTAQGRGRFVPAVFTREMNRQQADAFARSLGGPVGEAMLKHLAETGKQFVPTVLPNPSDASFQDLIARDPLNEAHASAYGDWLAEHGDPVGDMIHRTLYLNNHPILLGEYPIADSVRHRNMEVGAWRFGERDDGTPVIRAVARIPITGAMSHQTRAEFARHFTSDEAAAWAASFPPNAAQVLGEVVRRESAKPPKQYARRGTVRRYSSHEEFQKAIAEAPDDPQRALVYADWLEEQGDPLGEIIRNHFRAREGTGLGAIRWQTYTPDLSDTYHTGSYHIRVAPSYGDTHYVNVALPFRTTYQGSPALVGYSTRVSGAKARELHEYYTLREAKMKDAERPDRRQYGRGPVRRYALAPAEVHPDFRPGGVAARLGRHLQGVVAAGGEEAPFARMILTNAGATTEPLDPGPIHVYADWIDEHRGDSGGDAEAARWRQVPRGIAVDRAVRRHLDDRGLGPIRVANGLYVHRKQPDARTRNLVRTLQPRVLAAAVKLAVPDATRHDVLKSLVRLAIQGHEAVLLGVGHPAETDINAPLYARQLRTHGTPEPHDVHRYGRTGLTRTITVGYNRGVPFRRRPAMTTTAEPARYSHEAFQSAIRANPDDPGPRQVYADYLDELGDARGALSQRLVAAAVGAYGGAVGSIYPEHIDRAFGYPPGTASAVAMKVGPYSFNARRPDHVIDWVDRNRQALEEAAATRRREEQRRLFEQEQERLADAGDPKALLAIARGRAALEALVEGRKGKYVPKTSSVTASRKAVRLAKEVMGARLKRRQDRLAAEEALKTPPGRFAEMRLERLRRLAVRMGEDYHRSVRQLYQSSRADVRYGHGGQEDSDYLYGGSWKSTPARWRNGGARLDDVQNPTHVILENHRGTEVARLPLPPREVAAGLQPTPAQRATRPRATDEG